jgi:hypothetical protein
LKFKRLPTKQFRINGDNGKPFNLLLLLMAINIGNFVENMESKTNVYLTQVIAKIKVI